MTQTIEIIFDRDHGDQNYGWYARKLEQHSPVVHDPAGVPALNSPAHKPLPGSARVRNPAALPPIHGLVFSEEAKHAMGTALNSQPQKSSAGSADVAQLESEIERLNAVIEARESLISERTQEIERLRNVLWQYADARNWKRSRRDGPIDEWMCLRVGAWNGPDLARTALEPKP